MQAGSALCPGGVRSCLAWGRQGGYLGLYGLQQEGGELVLPVSALGVQPCRRPHMPKLAKEATVPHAAAARQRAASPCQASLSLCPPPCMAPIATIVHVLQTGPITVLISYMLGAAGRSLPSWLGKQSSPSAGTS